METCVAHVELLNEEFNGRVYLKKVLLCGVTKEGRKFDQTINYIYPTNRPAHKKLEDNDIIEDWRIGNVGIQRADEDLRAALRNFKLIICKQSAEVQILHDYCDRGSCTTIVPMQLILDDLAAKK